MIINIRGTSGSGKSTLVRNLMQYYHREPVFVGGRKRPMGYACAAEGRRRLWVVGHYETPCGGGDTVPSLDLVYEMVANAAPEHDVLFEGLIIQSDIKRCAALAKEHPLAVIILDVPLEVCLQSIQVRRDGRGDTRPLDPTNTISKLKTIPRQVARLSEAGVAVHQLGRAEAEAWCRAALGIPDDAIVVPEPPRHGLLLDL